jgi:alpha-D-ribose 1-methylphosphonate 5-triphosphate synthase subunit PhnG
MTPKEKAQEIYLKYYNSGCMGGYGYVPGCYRESAKQCALMAIDEIIQLDCLTDEGWLNVPQEYKIQYWKEVRKEIELL